MMWRSIFIALMAAWAAQAQDTGQKQFQAQGVVVGLSPAERTIEIRHQAITNYMPAMTMPFEVKDTNELAGLQTNDTIAFRLVVTKTNGWVEAIRKIASAETNNPPTTGVFRHVRDVEALHPGDLLPDYEFTNQFGQPFNTKEFRGQVLAIEFLFTRCPFPTFCPLMANNFAQVQNQLLAMPHGPTNWHLLTISFDPDFDTPDVLRRYAEAHDCKPARWTFATGALIDITAIADQLGEVFWHDETGSIMHNLRTAVIDPSGRIQKIFVGNQWTPDQLVAEMVKASKAGDPGSK